MAENPVGAFDIDQVVLLALRNASKDAREDTRDAMAEIANSVRERVASGDTGAAVTGSTAPGWGGGGALAFLPALALIVVAGVAGGVLGATGVFGSERVEVVSGFTAVLDETAPAAACPGGPVIGSLSAGDRVLAVARSDDSAYLGVRDPNDFARTLWFERSIVIVDGGQADIATLSVDSCPEALVQVVEPTPVPTEEPTDPGPVDTTSPSILQYWVTPDAYVYHDGVDNTAVIHVLATDNIAVATIDVTWSGMHSGSGQMTWTGMDWQFTYIVPIGTGFGDINFALRARDSAGNFSTPVYLKIRNDSVPI